MKVVCVDKAASDRIRLQKIFDSAFEQSRSTFGHLTIAHTVPATLEDLLLNKAPDVVAVGPGYSIEESYSACKRIAATFPKITIFLFLNPDSYSLRSLRRFQKLEVEIFSTDDSAVRIVHRLTQVDTQASTLKQGKLVTISGVKGGVGATTVVSALAHAAEATGKQAVVIDLSECAAFSQYMGIRRPVSADHSALITDNLTVDRAVVERCTVTAQNGVHVLLQPAGGTDSREAWLRDSERLETSLAVVHFLRELFDFVLVDIGGAEGIFPFALLAQADARLLVSSNDPASIHLLNSRLHTLANAPGEGLIHILINLLIDKGLTKSDIIDFLVSNESFAPQMALLEPISFDRRGQNWIGTGNTFYTESSPRIQELFEDVIQTITLNSQELERRVSPRVEMFSGVRRLTRTKLRLNSPPPIKALPEPTPIIQSASEQLLRPTPEISGPLFTAPQAVATFSTNAPSADQERLGDKTDIADQTNSENLSSLFRSPHAVVAT